eukprot:418170-Amphidinium_carterae.1
MLTVVVLLPRLGNVSLRNSALTMLGFKAQCANIEMLCLQVMPASPNQKLLAQIHVPNTAMPFLTSFSSCLYSIVTSSKTLRSKEFVCLCVLSGIRCPL